MPSEAIELNGIHRVVMVTPDRVIDRRILQEARSLVRAGKEVILIAAADGERSAFERMDGVKIERLAFDGVERRFRALTWGRQKTAALIGRARDMTLVASRWAGIVLTAPFGSLALAWRGLRGLLAGLAPFAVRRGVGRWVDRAYLRTRRIAAAAAQRRPSVVTPFFRFLGRCADRGFVLALSVAARISGTTAYEHVLTERIRFYRPDVVHAHDLPVLAASARAARQCRAACIYDSHELYLEEPMPASARRMLARRERKFAPLVDHVITVNHFLEDELRRRYRLEHVTVVENAIDRPAGFDPCDPHEAFREELGIEPPARIFLFQGWLAPGRNLDVLVRGFADTPSEAVLVLMGFGDYRAELEELVEREKLSGNVFFAAPRTQSELLFATASADVGVMPYAARGNLNNLYSSPNKLYEYVAAGLPVLANRLPFYEEVVGRFGFGLVTDLSTEEGVREGVRRMLEYDLVKLRARSRAAHHELNWTNESRKLLAVYERLEARRRETHGP